VSRKFRQRVPKVCSSRSGLMKLLKMSGKRFRNRFRKRYKKKSRRGKSCKATTLDKKKSPSLKQWFKKLLKRKSLSKTIRKIWP